MKVFLAVVSCFMSLSLAADETYQGMGSMKCYGDMSLTIRNDGEGFLDCQPAWGSPAAPPQVGFKINSSEIQSSIRELLLMARMAPTG